ncbi:hypothetical protein CDL15_Pgr021133 [Punica granatum]|uniref:Uncharacterized protein n=1 Tax=Punica granatum TaxID=22663 RepID=A0A218WJ16_PUNGR|nr:hypothetical protein CDL15_Pgr021133 [Punica granatum]
MQSDKTTIITSIAPSDVICFQLMNDADCGSNDPDLKQEMEKQFTDLLAEELKLQEAVAEEHTRHMNVTFAEAKRVASQYQREAEKCNAATEICEEVRERAEALLIKERKVTMMWEKRARQMGWEGE